MDFDFDEDGWLIFLIFLGALIKADTLGDNYCSNCGAELKESEET